MEHFITDLYLTALTHWMSWLINALFFPIKCSDCGPRMWCSVTVTQLSSEQQSQPAAEFALGQPHSWKPGCRKHRSTHSQQWGACQSTASIYIFVLLMKYSLSPSVVAQHRGWRCLQSPGRWVVGELWEGAPPSHQRAGSAQQWETTWAASKESLQWWEGAFSPPSSALLQAGKRAFKAQLTKEEQENNMQIREEINFRRVSFLIMTQLFREADSVALEASKACLCIL